MGLSLNFSQEISVGERFQFGANWQRFLQFVNEARIAEAEKSLQFMFEVESLAGKHFLDIGSGSGLFSLAACRLGAIVHSFDYDQQSVACTTELRRRFFSGNEERWKVEQGSILDSNYLASIGTFEYVYSWGVLHHTGAMWQALGNAVPLVASEGKLFIAIYNDQGRASLAWKKVKQIYNILPGVSKWLILFPSLARLWGPTILRDFIKGIPFYTWRNYSQNRGMSPWHDVVDWVGGYPFEVAKPEQVFDFYRAKGFNLLKLKTCAGGIGCNEFVFTKQFA